MPGQACCRRVARPLSADKAGPAWMMANPCRRKSTMPSKASPGSPLTVAAVLLHHSISCHADQREERRDRPTSDRRG